MHISLYRLTSVGLLCVAVSAKQLEMSSQLPAGTSIHAFIWVTWAQGPERPVLQSNAKPHADMYTCI